MMMRRRRRRMRMRMKMMTRRRMRMMRMMMQVSQALSQSKVLGCSIRRVVYRQTRPSVATELVIGGKVDHQISLSATHCGHTFPSEESYSVQLTSQPDISTLLAPLACTSALNNVRFF
jgi:hypothetical protein